MILYQKIDVSFIKDKKLAKNNEKAKDDKFAEIECLFYTKKNKVLLTELFNFHIFCKIFDNFLYFFHNKNSLL